MLCPTICLSTPGRTGWLTRACSLRSPSLPRGQAWDDEGGGISATCAVRPTCGECGSVRLTGASADASAAGDRVAVIGWCEYYVQERPP